MENKKISDFADELESTIQPSNIFIKIIQHSGGPDKSHIRANRAGYLHLASLFLRAAIAPFKGHKHEDIVDVNPSDLIDEDSDIYFHWFERSETIEKPKQRKPRIWDILFPIGCIALVVLFCALFFIGLFTAMGWIF